MRRLMLVSVMALGLAGRAAAQDSDSVADPARAGQLRQQIENRFAARVQEELGLNDEQFRRVRATSAQFGVERQKVEQQERVLRQAIAFQLRPGVAANQDSVARLIEAMITARSAYVQISRDEMRALSSFLTPVQRAQFYILRERLLDLADQVRTQRRLQRQESAAPLRQRRRP